jgi:hypothetical protein
MEYNPAFIYPANLEGSHLITQTARSTGWPLESSKALVKKIMILRNANVVAGVWASRAPMYLAAITLPKS